MKTVLYLDWKRNKTLYIRKMLVPMIWLAVFFVISVLVDRFAPVVNYRYMRWPDMVKDLVGLPSWNRNLYGNLWQMFALFYPFYFVYTVMTGLTGNIIGEERMETVVYMKNLSVGRHTMLIGKILMWSFWFVVSGIAIGLENVVFFLILQSKQMLTTVVHYQGELMLVTLFYMAVAIFMASVQKHEQICEEHIFTLLVLSFIVARVYAVVEFFAQLLTETGREGTVVDTLYMLAKRLEVLRIAAPFTWCWPVVTVENMFLIAGAAAALILLVTGYSIYTHEKVIYRDR